MTGVLMASTVVVPGSVTALADRVSGPVGAAAAVVVGALLLILVVWLARKVVHKIIGIAVSVGVATATHERTWLQVEVQDGTDLAARPETANPLWGLSTALVVVIQWVSMQFRQCGGGS